MIDVALMGSEFLARVLAMAAVPLPNSLGGELRPAMRNSITWLLSLVLAVVFVVVGLANLTLQPHMVQRFESYGYPVWFLALTGAFEIFGAALVLVPRTAYIGAGLLAAITCGAFISLMANGHTSGITAPISLFLLALVVGSLHDWGRSPQT